MGEAQVAASWGLGDLGATVVSGLLFAAAVFGWLLFRHSDRVS